MSHCTVDDVEAIVDTDMGPNIIQSLIEEVDALIAMKLTVSGVATNVLRAISRTWTAYRVMLKDPAAQSREGETDNRTENLRHLKAMYMEMLADASGGIAFTMTSSPIE